MLGVERGPSPPLLSGAPESPPPLKLAKLSGASHFSLPVAASRATSVSWLAPSISLSARVKALPPPTTKEEKPPWLGAFQTIFGELVHGLPTRSVVAPSPFTPRYCGHSPAKRA